jgi:hypothetical protein
MAGSWALPCQSTALFRITRARPLDVPRVLRRWSSRNVGARQCRAQRTDPPLKHHGKDELCPTSDLAKALEAYPAKAISDEDDRDEDEPMPIEAGFDKSDPGEA